MKKNVLVILFLGCLFNIGAQIKYNDYFNNSVLRIDLIMAGTASTQTCFTKQAYSEKEWGGRRTNLSIFNNKGQYKFNVYDAKSGELIYTDGFCTLFQEWQTTTEALKMKRAFENTIRMPMPKSDIKLEVINRIKGAFTDTILAIPIVLDAQFIIPAISPKAKVKEIMSSGTPSECIDIVLIAEGYTKHEEDKFFEDALLFTDGLFTSAPFNEHKSKINIHAVMAYSQESGVDDPHNSIFKNTALEASYNTLYSDRYLMAPEVSKVSNYAGLVPYDQIVILANTEKYGGGGIYNFYSINSTRGRKNLEVFIHEFGHSFAGLADEYYNSEVSYNDYFPLDIEPWEPNITTRVNFSSKWEYMIDDDTPIPTPAKTKYENAVGLFEGGGYVAKGVFRPFIDCRMKTNEAKDFCPVCSVAVVKTIEFYTAD